MKAIYRFLTCFALTFAPNLIAQTYQASATPQTPFSCGPTPIYCYGVPFFLNGDKSQPVSTPWIDVNPTYGTGDIAFAADGDQGPLAQYGTQHVDTDSMQVTYTYFTPPGRPTVKVVSAISFSFGGNLGTFFATFGHFYSSGSGRGGGGSGVKTTLTGGTIVINQTSSAAATADSLVLPLGRILPADTGSGPPPSACPSGVYYASQPCGPAYQCGQNHYCQCWKAYCEVSQEYGIYQWVYWQRQW